MVVAVPILTSVGYCTVLQ